MSLMFRNCSSLKEINLSKFSTVNVAYMNEMFFGCSSIKKINLESFKSDNIDKITNMFGNIPNSCTLICKDKIFLEEFKKK